MAHRQSPTNTTGITLLSDLLKAVGVRLFLTDDIIVTKTRTPCIPNQPNTRTIFVFAVGCRRARRWRSSFRVQAPLKVSPSPNILLLLMAVIVHDESVEEGSCLLHSGVGMLLLFWGKIAAFPWNFGNPRIFFNFGSPNWISLPIFPCVVLVRHFKGKKNAISASQLVMEIKICQTAVLRRNHIY